VSIQSQRSYPLAWARVLFLAVAVALVIGGVGVVLMEHASMVPCGDLTRTGVAIHGPALGKLSPVCTDPINAGRAREMAVDLGYAALRWSS
jgi:hypothetical protein